MLATPDAIIFDALRPALMAALRELLPDLAALVAEELQRHNLDPAAPRRYSHLLEQVAASRNERGHSRTGDIARRLALSPEATRAWLLEAAEAGHVMELPAQNGGSKPTGCWIILSHNWGRGKQG